MTQTTLDMQEPAALDAQPTQEQVNALALPQRAAIALNSSKTEKDLIALAESTKNVTAVVDTAGRTQVHKMYMAAKDARIAVAKVSTDARDDALKFQKAVIAEEKRLIGIIEPEEKRLMRLRDDYDVKAKKEEEERQAKERARIAEIKQRIDAVRNLKFTMVGKTSEQLAQMLETASMPPEYETFGEFAQEFKTVRDEVIELLGTAQLAAFNAEQEQARKDAEAAAMAQELANMRAANAKLLAEKEARETAAKAIESARAIPVQTNVIATPAPTGGYRMRIGEPTISRTPTANVAVAAAPQVEAAAAVASIVDVIDEKAPEIEYPKAQDIIDLVASVYELSVEEAQDLLSKLDFSELAQAA